ncbi:hypothetical protein MUB24_06820 [Lederbergia sp. NSJ-179]|uniref:hypothetical protein n=1 Tax=Lederbergia sp. NSJ-179 TaxID=2931402 RepID=UPI001FD3DE2F|nr:hypothetical protein [Lederbergia sp. NSJ-179]MCJ7840623.1 hypothetical protein [Lederbergia sp. NSJ-179]
MFVYAKIKGVMSYGKRVGRDYQLVCQGRVENRREIKLSPMIYFLESSSSETSPEPVVLLTSFLFVQTVIDLTSRTEQNEWDIRIIIDLKSWSFYIEDHEEKSFMPNEIKVLIFSSFGIQIEQKRLTLDVLASRKHIMSENHP